MATVTDNTEVKPANVGPVIFKLSAPLSTHKGIVNELELKQPKAGAFIKYGAPWSEITTGSYPKVKRQFEYNWDALMGFVYESSGHDKVVLSEISSGDMMVLAEVMTGVIATRNPL